MTVGIGHLNVLISPAPHCLLFQYNSDHRTYSTSTLLRERCSFLIKGWVFFFNKFLPSKFQPISIFSDQRSPFDCYVITVSTSLPSLRFMPKPSSSAYGFIIHALVAQSLLPFGKGFLWVTHEVAGPTRGETSHNNRNHLV